MPDVIPPPALPPVPEDCAGSYTVKLICGSPPYFVYAADSPSSSDAMAAKKPCGGGVENPVAAAVQAGWTPANVLKLVAALTK